MSTHFLGTKVVGLSSASQVVPKGFILGTTLSSVDTDLVAANIKSGVNVFGVTGTCASGGYLIKDTGQTMIYVTNDDGSFNPAAQQPSYYWGDAPYQNLVVDVRTSLEWAFSPGLGAENGSPCNWSTAITRAEASTYQDFTDWRLPNLNELITLLEYTQSVHAYNPDWFTGVISSGLSEYWSSTTVQANTNYAWTVDFNTGIIAPRLKTVSDTYLVWPVRDVVL